MSVIKEGDVIVIQRFNYMRTHTLISKKDGPNVQLGKDIIVNLAPIVGEEFGTTFKMIPKAAEDAQTKSGGRKNHYLLEKSNDIVDFEETFLDDVQESGEDNRDISDENTSQKLSKEEIETMRAEGKSGKEIVAQLIENSESFQKKTKFSQAKFLKKKAKKYFEYLIIRKPSIRLLMEIHYKADPRKIMNLRIDSLAQLLNNVNVRCGGRYLVYETGCQGLLVAAVLERVGENGKVVHIFQTGNPQTQSLNAMNFNAAATANLSTLNMYHLRSLEQGHDIAQMHQESAAKDGSDKVPYRQVLRESSIASFKMIQETPFDGLIIACRQHPTSLLLFLLKYLKPSRPFAVFSPYKEPLLDAYMQVKATGKAVMVTLSETWLRHNQVLPGRTHPEVTMSGGGGYILTGTIVDNSEPEGYEDVISVNGSTSKKRKRFRQR